MGHMGEYNAAKELAEELWPDYRAHRFGVFRLVLIAARRGLCGHIASDALSYLRQWEKEGKREQA
jgi:hypothetical protein